MKCGNEIKELNILAVAENEKAVVEILGNENLVEGNNEINVRVTAEDGTTEKIYLLTVYKRTLEEEQALVQEVEENVIENIVTIVNEEQKKKNNTIVITIASIAGVAVLGVAGYFIYRRMR